MAWKLQGADPLGQTCVVVSLAMLDPLLDAMDEPQEEPARVLRQSASRRRNFSIFIPIAWLRSRTNLRFIRTVTTACARRRGRTRD